MTEVSNAIAGLDGKQYPRHRFEGRGRLGLIGYVHARHHAGVSIRGIQHDLAEQGIRRSVGSIDSYLTGYRCATCSGGQDTRHLNTEEVSGNASTD